jgi:hypothetical protein
MSCLDWIPVANGMQIKPKHQECEAALENIVQCGCWLSNVCVPYVSEITAVGDPPH